MPVRLGGISGGLGVEDVRCWLGIYRDLFCLRVLFIALHPFFRHQQYQAFIPFQHQVQTEASYRDEHNSRPTQHSILQSHITKHHTANITPTSTQSNSSQSTHNQKCVSAPAPQHKAHTRKLHIPAPSKSKPRVNLSTVHTTIHGFSVHQIVRVAGQGEVGQLDLYLQLLLAEEEISAVVGLVVEDIMVEDVMMVGVEEEVAAGVVVADVRRR